MPNYNSFYKNLANKSLDWLVSDTRKLYVYNLKNRYNELKHNGWIDRPFTYDFNSHGFRTPEFSTETTLMALGCSNTMGIGLPNDSIWCSLVSKELGVHCANLGIGGSGPDTAFRLCLGYIDKIKPKIVIHMVNPGLRFELVDDIKITMINGNSPDSVQLYYRLFTDDNNYFFNLQKNTLAIQMLCAERKIKFLQIHAHDVLDCEHRSMARDLHHEGVNEHKSAAEKILAMI